MAASSIKVNQKLKANVIHIWHVLCLPIQNLQKVLSRTQIYEETPLESCWLTISEVTIADESYVSGDVEIFLQDLR